MHKRVLISETSFYGRFFKWNNLFPTYSHSVSSGGVQTSDEWKTVREKQFSTSRNQLLNFRLTTYENYRKIGSALTLMRVLDLRDFERIGAIGDSPFVQSICLSDVFKAQHTDYLPRRFLLTDFEEASIDYGKKLGLEGFEFHKFDLINDELTLFEGCQLLLMWGVDCVVEDSTLVKLFEYCRKNNVKLVVASINVESLRRNWMRFLGITHIRSMILGRNFGNLHAFLRSEKYFGRLAATAQVRFATLFSDEIYRVYLVG